MGITEIISRSDQGRTQPFLCRGDDGVEYFVKGRHAGLRSLCCEWIAARLAQAFGLPTPHPVICEVPEELIASSVRSDAAELGAGPAFGSTFVENITELTVRTAHLVGEDTRRWVLLFDWWVRNGDRTLTEFGGNPNLFWSNGGLGLVVLDFNLTFDRQLGEKEFWTTHAFRLAASGWDAEFRAEAEGRMEAVLSRLPEIWEELPVGWRYLDGDPTLPESLSRTEVESILGRFRNDPSLFWGNRP